MRRSIRPPLALLTAVLAATLAMAGPATAKEGLEARLDAPIPMGTPGGTVLLVGIMVTGPAGTDPVVGTPMYLRLVGRDGAISREAGAGDRIPGHYTFEITVPAGGARRIEIGIHGTSDLPITVVNDPFVFGDVRAGTAQVAPPATAAPLITQHAVPAPAIVPAPDPASVTAAPTAASSDGSLPVAAGGAVIALIVVVAVLAAVRLRRGARVAAAREARDVA